MDEQGRQVHVASVDDLGQHVRQGDVNDDTELYDALEDRWAPAHQHPLYVSTRDRLAPDSGPQETPRGGPPGAPVSTKPPAPQRPPTPPPGRGGQGGGGATAQDQAALDRDWSSALKDEFLGAVPGPTPAGLSPAKPGSPLPEEPQSGGMDFDDLDALEPTSFTRAALSSQEASESRGAPKKRDMETIDGASNVFTSLDDPTLKPLPAEPSSFDDLQRPTAQGMQFEEFMPSPQSAPSAAPAPAPAGEAASPSLEDADEDFFLIEDPSLSGDAPPPSTSRKGASARRASRKMLKAVVGLAVFALLMSVAVPRLVRLGAALMATRASEEVPVRPGDGLSDQLKTEAFFLAARAQEDAFTSLDSIRRNLGVDAAPPSAWMEGIYFAHASRYPAAQSYWERYGSYMRYGQRELPVLFEAALRRQVARSAIVPSAQEEVIALVLSDFEGRLPAMTSAFADLIGLADAALELHSFLVLKEDEIEYTPFTRSGVSRDPIVEAVPATEQTRVDFWKRLEGVTDRLEALGTLERVTTSRLQESLLDRLREVGY